MNLSALVAESEGIDEPEDAPLEGPCCICYTNGACYPVDGPDGVFSDAFTSSDALGPGTGVCYRCKHLADWREFRRYHWVASREGIEIIKERPILIDHLLDPPSGPWMIQYKDGSDFLTILNGWIYGQRLNTSTEKYRMLVDKRPVHVDREKFAAMIAFGRELRGRGDAPSKRTLKGGVTAGDLARYDLSREETHRITDELAGRDDWRIAVQLIQ